MHVYTRPVRHTSLSLGGGTGLTAARHGVDQTVPALRRQRRVWRDRQPEGQHRLRDPPGGGEGQPRRRGRVRTRVHLGRP